MKLLTKLKLRLEVVLKAVNLDWREVAVELMNDLLRSASVALLSSKKTTI